MAAGLSVLVTAGAILDLFYYSELLEGAVQATIDLERAHPQIQLSTVIRDRVGFGVKAPWFAYGIVWLPLIGFTIWSWVEHKFDRARQLGELP